MSITEVTKKGDKIYNDQARNFHEGSVQLANRALESGLVAYIKRDFVNPNRPGKGYKYNGLYFAKLKRHI